MADLRAEVFAQLIQLMGDLRKIGSAQLLELRAIRMSLADGDDSPATKKLADKAEGETLLATAGAGSSGAPSDPIMAAVETIAKEQLAKGMGIDLGKLLSGNTDQAAIEMALRAGLANPAAQPKPPA